MERQRVFDGMGDSTKWDMIQFRVKPDLKKKFHLWCDQHDISVSTMLRMLCAKVISNRQNFPYQREVTEEMGAAVEDVMGFIPFVKHSPELARKIF